MIARGALCAAVLAVALCGPATAGDTRTGQVPSLRLIGMQVVPPTAGIGGVPFGGISGIDFDPRTGEWVLLSDDRSATGPARFYRAGFRYDGGHVEGLEVREAVVLRRADGSPFPPVGGGGEVADGEAVRFDPRTGDIVWASEGDYSRGFGTSVRDSDRRGYFLGAWGLPPMFAADPAGRRGPRSNRSIEGLAFAPDGNSLWVGLEAPLHQDGAVADATNGALVRLSRIDRGGRLLAQYAYSLDPIPGVGAATVADNGVAEILALDADRLLVLERAGVQAADGSFRFHVRLYAVTTAGAADVGRVRSLAGRARRPLAKRLVLDFDALPGPVIDNLEAMAWGPSLANGNATLVLASDDNFDARQQTQLVVFEVTRNGPRAARKIHGR